MSVDAFISKQGLGCYYGLGLATSAVDRNKQNCSQEGRSNFEIV